jgi:hypothetical protein
MMTALLILAAAMQMDMQTLSAPGVPYTCAPGSMSLARIPKSRVPVILKEAQRKIAEGDITVELRTDRGVLKGYIVDAQGAYYACSKDAKWLHSWQMTQMRSYS